MGTTLKDYLHEGGILDKGFQDSQGNRYKVEEVIGPNGFGAVGLKVRYVGQDNQFAVEPKVRSLGFSLTDCLVELSTIKMPHSPVKELPELVAF